MYEFRIPKLDGSDWRPAVRITRGPWSVFRVFCLEREADMAHAKLFHVGVLNAKIVGQDLEVTGVKEGNEIGNYRKVTDASSN